MARFYEMTFPELTSFDDEMLKRTTFVQRHMAVFPNQYRTGTIVMAWASLTLCCPLMFQHTLKFYSLLPGQVSLILSNTRIPKNVLLLLFKNNNK